MWDRSGIRTWFRGGEPGWRDNGELTIVPWRTGGALRRSERVPGTPPIAGELTGWKVDWCRTPPGLAPGRRSPGSGWSPGSRLDLSPGCSSSHLVYRIFRPQTLERYRSANGCPASLDVGSDA